MKKVKPIIYTITAVICMFVMSCAREGTPNKQGELLSIAQIKALGENQSMKDKLVTVEGYASICRVGAPLEANSFKQVMVYADGFCEGEELLNVNLMFRGESYAMYGDKYRNHASVKDLFTNESIIIMTDDYQELPNGKFKFSGTLVYEGDDYYLNEITIHK